MSWRQQGVPIIFWWQACSKRVPVPSSLFRMTLYYHFPEREKYLNGLTRFDRFFFVKIHGHFWYWSTVNLKTVRIKTFSRHIPNESRSHILIISHDPLLQICRNENLFQWFTCFQRFLLRSMGMFEVTVQRNYNEYVAKTFFRDRHNPS